MNLLFWSLLFSFGLTNAFLEIKFTYVTTGQRTVAKGSTEFQTSSKLYQPGKNTSQIFSQLHVSDSEARRDCQQSCLHPDAWCTPLYSSISDTHYSSECLPVHELLYANRSNQEGDFSLTYLPSSSSQMFKGMTIVDNAVPMFLSNETFQVYVVDTKSYTSFVNRNSSTYNWYPECSCLVKSNECYVRCTVHEWDTIVVVNSNPGPIFIFSLVLDFSQRQVAGSQKALGKSVSSGSSWNHLAKDNSKKLPWLWFAIALFYIAL